MSRNGWRLLAAAGGGVALSFGAAGGLSHDDLLLRAWLAAVTGSTGLSLGALMLLQAHDLTGGSWGVAARPALTAISAMMPLNALAFLPVCFGLAQLYPWATLQPERNFYLTPSFFLLRMAVYFALWLALTVLASRRGAAPHKPSGWSAPGLILLGLTVTFSAFDWTMSLDPDWSSSIYGMFVTASDLVGALAAATLVLALSGAARPGVGKDALNDLASLLLAGILLWAYLALMQFVIIWEENLPEEITWYLYRIVNGWAVIDWALAGCAVALPFAILVAWPLKRRPGWVAAASLFLLAGYVLTQWWLILPPRRIGWLGPWLFIGFGGVWLALFDWRLERGRFFGTAVRALPGEAHA
ncbi:MAG: hypothetical protein JO038_04695 [Alphaproteobacteria bacterium]|nr:hypothetical protein [Alphaproteobacteria bacterium]